MNEPMVTITADEYFHLREQAEMNIYLTRELAETKTYMDNLDRRLYEIERKIERIEQK